MLVLIAKIVTGIGILIATILLVRLIRRNSIDYRPLREPDVEPDAEKIAAAINAAHGPGGCVARRQGDTVIVENAPLDPVTSKRIDDFFDEQRKRAAPSFAAATDRETVEKIAAFVDDWDTPETRAAYTLQTRKAAIEIATGRPWHPLPIEELRRKWED